MIPAQNLRLLINTNRSNITSKLWKPPTTVALQQHHKKFSSHPPHQFRFPGTSSTINWSQQQQLFSHPLFETLPTTTTTLKSEIKMSGNLPISSQAIIISTSLVTFISGFLLGIYSIRGYLISPALADERNHNLYDPLESEESDIDEDDTILDHAPNWSNGAEADRRQGLSASASASKSSGSSKKTGDKDKEKTALAEPENNEECKLVLVVRTDLGMTKGKIAAQCSHATLACYKTLLRAAQRKGEASPEAKLLRQWERRGQAKIAVQVKSQEELLTLQAKARSVGVTAEAIVDAGRTQIEAGSMTVLGVGPAPKSKVDLVTGGLKLL